MPDRANYTTTRASSRYADNYGDYQDEPRTHTSTRRYKPQEQVVTRGDYTQQRPVTRRTTAQDVVEDYTTVDVVEPRIQRASRPAANTRTHPPTAQRGDRMQASGRPRPHTDEDRQILPEYRKPRHPVQPAPAPVEPARSKDIHISISRRTLLRAASGVLSVYLGARGLIALGSFARSEWEQFGREINEGQYPSTYITLVCGHDDSAQFPTELRAFVRSDRYIQFEEISTKSHQIARYFVSSEPVPFTGPINQINLKILPQRQADGKFQIVVHVECGGVGPYAQIIAKDYLFADTGKGYFVGIQPKGGKA